MFIIIIFRVSVASFHDYPEAYQPYERALSYYMFGFVLGATLYTCNNQVEQTSKYAAVTNITFKTNAIQYKNDKNQRHFLFIFQRD
jgi:hypothetical protein